MPVVGATSITVVPRHTCEQNAARSRHDVHNTHTHTHTHTRARALAELQDAHTVYAKCLRRCMHRVRRTTSPSGLVLSVTVVGSSGSAPHTHTHKHTSTNKHMVRAMGCRSQCGAVGYQSCCTSRRTARPGTCTEKCMSLIVACTPHWLARCQLPPSSGCGFASASTGTAFCTVSCSVNTRLCALYIVRAMCSGLL